MVWSYFRCASPERLCEKLNEEGFSTTLLPLFFFLSFPEGTCCLPKLNALRFFSSLGKTTSLPVFRPQHRFAQPRIYY